MGEASAGPLKISSVNDMFPDASCVSVSMREGPGGFAITALIHHDEEPPC